MEVEAWTGASPSNLALASNGGVASVSSSWGSCCGAETLNNGDRKTPGWNDAAPANTFSDWAEVDFSGSKSISEIDVFTLQDNWSSPSDPTETMTFSLYGLTGYEVQYWNGSSWVDVPGGSVSGNNKVWRKFTFSPITTTKIRVLTNASVDGYSRLTEVEAWSAPPTAQIHWLVTDQLGTPRMIFDQTGSLANVSRHDYLPFGEELFASEGGRTQAQGYTLSDNVRQKFTQKERDNETGLDYFGARYYASTQGRFTTVDPLMASATAEEPQSWNRYVYVDNRPLGFVDDGGLIKRRKDGSIKFWTSGEPTTARNSGQTFTVLAGQIETDKGSAVTAFFSTDKDRSGDADCHGLTFADGEFGIDNPDVSTILRDEYKEETVGEARAGDVAVYEESKDGKKWSVVHSATVVSTENGQVLVAGVNGTEQKSKTTGINEQWTAKTNKKGQPHEVRVTVYTKPSMTVAERERNVDRAKTFDKAKVTKKDRVKRTEKFESPPG